MNLSNLLSDQRTKETVEEENKVYIHKNLSPLVDK